MEQGQLYNKVEYLEPKTIKLHPEIPNVRSSITKDSIKDLMRSIKETGVQNPITCFQSNGETFLVSGERRLRCVIDLHKEDPKDARFKAIPVLVKHYDPKTVIKDALYDNLIENIQREDLSGHDLATRIKLFVDNGMGKQEICERTGKSISWLNTTLKFLEADDTVKELVKEGKLTLDEGRIAARISEPVIQAAAARAMAKAKESGDKGKVRSTKKQARQAGRKRSSEKQSTKEVTKASNTIGVIIRAMRDKKEVEGNIMTMFKAGRISDRQAQAMALFAFQTALRWVLGEEQKGLGLDKFLKTYKLAPDKAGNLVRQRDLKDQKKKKAKKK